MIWINMVGTYGVASAQFYWGRMAGLILRILYNLGPEIFDITCWKWLFIYVDDLLAFFHLAVLWEEATVLLVFLEVIGAPINYKKVFLGLYNIFVGFYINTKLHHYALTQVKMVMLLDISKKIDSAETIAVEVIRSYTHKSAWAVQVSEPLRPFLQPLFHFIQATADMPPKARVIVPALCRFVNRFLAKHWGSQSPSSAEFRRLLGIASGTDAGASEQVGRTIGGWCGPPRGNRWDMEWYSIRLEDHRYIPWVKALLDQLYPGIQITAASGALELAGNLIMMKHLEKRIQGGGIICQASVSMTSGSTDNIGNVYVLAKHYTSRWPGAAILMEIAAIMLQTESHMSIGHVPRERNEWADALANLITDGFDPAKRWDPIAELKETIVLSDLLIYGEQLGLHLPKKQRAALHQHPLKACLAPPNLSRPFHGKPAADSQGASKKPRVL